MKSLPGWTTEIEEISSGVFKVTLIDSFGHNAELIGKATDDTIKKAYAHAFEIEKHVSKNWNKFLYDFCISELHDSNITAQDYNDKVFGSWLVEVGNNRLVYMGKDRWLVGQLRKDNEWFDKTILNKDELTFPIFLAVINSTK
ncbi:hypothetical protein [Mucilaginibacter sp.]|uniref:hypothetical protein n=1 Tax=Mucilaginibacter sp. TaxID=1882438 RepID=UPI003B0088AB